MHPLYSIAPLRLTIGKSTQSLEVAGPCKSITKLFKSLQVEIHYSKCSVTVYFHCRSLTGWWNTLKSFTATEALCRSWLRQHGLRSATCATNPLGDRLNRQRHARHRLVSSLLSPEVITWPTLLWATRNWGHDLGKSTWMKQPSGSLVQLNWAKKNMCHPEQQFILNKMWSFVFFCRKALGNQQTNWYWPSPAAPWILQSKALKMLASAPVDVCLIYAGPFGCRRGGLALWKSGACPAP